MSYKRQRIYPTPDNIRSREMFHQLEHELQKKDTIIRELQDRIDILSRKKTHVQRAYYTMVRDTRAEATKMRLFLEKVDDDGEEDGEMFHEDLVHTVKKMSCDLINLGHCPLSHEPLGDNTFINICGHIFDKRALMSKKPSNCPKCSHKMMIVT